MKRSTKRVGKREKEREKGDIHRHTVWPWREEEKGGTNKEERKGTKQAVKAHTGGLTVKTVAAVVSQRLNRQHLASAALSLSFSFLSSRHHIQFTTGDL